MVVQGMVLFLSGPALATWIAGSAPMALMEGASIWCFMSLMQILCMLFIARDTILKGAPAANVSVAATDDDVAAKKRLVEDGEPTLRKRHALK